MNIPGVLVMKSSFVRYLILCTLVLTTTLTLPPPALAEEDPLIMGVFPRRNATVTMSMFKPMADYLTQQLGREVKLETHKNLKSFWEKVKQRRYDIMHNNQYFFVKAKKEYGYQILLKNEEFGNLSISGALLVRKDSGIETINDLKGKTVIFGGGQGAMISYLVPTYLMRQAGLNKDDYEEKFAKNPPHSIFAMFYKQAGAAGASGFVIDFPTIKQKIDTSQIHILAESKPLAPLTWSVKNTMDIKLRQQIQSVLVDLKNTKKGKEILKKAMLTGLSAANDDEFDIHREIIRVVLGEDY